MLPHNEYVLDETQRMHRNELLQEVAQARLFRLVCAPQPGWIDSGLAFLGRALVRLGRWLELRVPVGLNDVQS